MSNMEEGNCPCPSIPCPSPTMLSNQTSLGHTATSGLILVVKEWSMLIDLAEVMCFIPGARLGSYLPWNSMDPQVEFGGCCKGG